MADVKKILTSLKRFFAKKRALGKPFHQNDPEKRMEMATGLSGKAINSLLEDGEENIEKPTTINLDEFDLAVIRNKVHAMYRRNEVVTLRTLKAKLFPEMTVSLTTLWRALRFLGFRFTKKAAGRRVVERADVVSQRHQYLREIRRARERGDHIVYLDETWVNVNHAYGGEWSENTGDSVDRLLGFGCGECGRNVPSGKGKRLIVLDAGCRDVGLLPSVADVFVAKSESGDYHSEMNHEHFLSWWRDTLLPALPGPSTIVLDKAPYHCVLTDDSRAPTTQWTVPTIRTWLRDRGIFFADDLLKAELLEIVRRNKPLPCYIVDQLAAAAGHKVLRLPPRHCELNPIELIWAQIKGFVARNNTSFKLVETMKLFHEGKSLITAAVWNKAEDHVIQDVETRLWEGENVQDLAIEPVIISIDEAEDGLDETFNDDPEQLTDAEALNNCDDVPTTDQIQQVETDDACCDMDTEYVVPCLMCSSVKDPPDSVIKKGARRKRDKKRVSAVFEWVQCDACDKCAHVDCIPGCDTVGIFFCPPCKRILHTSYMNKNSV